MGQKEITQSSHFPVYNKIRLFEDLALFRDAISFVFVSCVQTMAFSTLFRNVSDLSCWLAANRAKISIILILSVAIGGVSPRINGNQNARIGTAVFYTIMAHASSWPLDWVSRTPPPKSLFAICIANPMRVGFK